MGIRHCAALALLLTGCAQIAGIDETSGPVGDAPPPDRVQLTFERISIGTTVERSPLDLTGQTATYLVPSTTAANGLDRVTPTLEGSTWVSNLTAPAPVEFTLPDHPTSVLRNFDFPVPALLAGYAVYEHPSPSPASATATLAVAVTSDVAFTGAEGYELYTVGSWTQRPLVPPAVGDVTLDPTPFTFISSSSIGGRPHIALAAGDALIVSRYAGNQLVATLEVTAAAQTEADTISGALVAVPQDQTLDLTFDYAATAARFMALGPPMTPGSAAWYLRAAPAGAIAIDTGPLLHAVGVTADTVNPIAATYGNPFSAKWPTTMTLVANASRTYAVPSLGNLALTLSSRLLQVGPPAPGAVASFDAGLPTRIQIGGTLLTTDGVDVAKPTQPIAVTFMTSSADNSIYSLQLFEVALNPAGDAVTRTLVVAMAAAEARFVIPAELLVADKLYTVRAFVQKGGVSGLATGDLRTDGPYSQAFHDSGVFKVVP